MKNKITLKILFTLLYFNFFFGNNLLKIFKEKTVPNLKKIEKNLKKNWKKFLSAHFVFSTFGAYRLKNKICKQESIESKDISMVDAFYLNFIPLKFDISYILDKDPKKKNIYKNMFKLTPLMPVFIRQEIAFLITKQKKKE